MVLRDIFDLQHRSKVVRKPSPYPRPWDKQARKFGSGAVSVAEFEQMKARAAESN